MLRRRRKRRSSTSLGDQESANWALLIRMLWNNAGGTESGKALNHHGERSRDGSGSTGEFEFRESRGGGRPGDRIDGGVLHHVTGRAGEESTAHAWNYEIGSFA